METQELIFENRILLILKRCSHHEFLADLAQIFKKRLRTSRRINKQSVTVKVWRFKESEKMMYRWTHLQNSQSPYGAPASQGGQVFLQTYSLWGKRFQDFFASMLEKQVHTLSFPMTWQCRETLVVPPLLLPSANSTCIQDINSGPNSYPLPYSRGCIQQV